LVSTSDLALPSDSNAIIAKSAASRRRGYTVEGERVGVEPAIVIESKMKRERRTVP
jgi:hypothetical protein